jgi:cbb3-type cytochrome c oxidase subunit III
MKTTYILASVALAVAIAACGSGSSQSSSASAASSSANTAAANTGAASASDGANVFQTNCSSCHGANGEGSPGAFPPLAGNPVVVGPAKNVIHIVKFGLHGSIAVKGMTYNGMMPAWGGQLSNADIAAAITFVRSSWGNKASAVSEADVAAVKQ